MTIKVIAAAFPTNIPAFLIGQIRTWGCPELATNLVLEADSSVTVGQSGTNLSVCMINACDTHVLVARVSSNGAIVASTRLNAFWIQGAVESYVWKVASYPDGSGLFEDEIIMKNLPPDVDVKISVIVDGVTFEDMSTERWIHASDFSELGEYKFRLLRSPTGFSSVCHQVEMYQDGVYLGEAYYNGLLMPRE